MAGHRKWSGPACTYCGRKIQHRDALACWRRMWDRMTGRWSEAELDRLHENIRHLVETVAAGGTVEVAP